MKPIKEILLLSAVTLLAMQTAFTEYSFMENREQMDKLSLTHYIPNTNNMKNTIILLLAFAALTGAYVKSDKTAVAEVVELRDVTEEYIAEPKPEEIYSLYDLKTNKWDGGIFRFSDISDVSYNRTKEVRISPANKWLSNEFEREKAVQGFFSGISEIHASPEKAGRPHSSVYLPIARELNRFTKSKAKKKIMLVYSDLKENTPEWSFYKKKLQLLKTNTDSVGKYFDSLLPLQNLKGIQVYLIYQPKNAEDDEAYKIVSDFYRNLLDSKGATVTIGANLVL